jgi:tetratricopeptide (TPR) repeat protein
MDSSRVEPLIKLKTIYQKDLEDPEKAEEILLKIYAKDPNDVLLLQELGIFYLNQKDYAKAKTFFEQVKVLEPLNVNNLMNLSYCQFEMEDYAAAKVNNQLVLNIDPLNIDALSDAKYIAYKQNDNAAALEYLKQLLSQRDDDKDYQEIVILLREAENYTELITYATKWHRYDETSKEAVQWLILGAQMTNNKDMMQQYSNILKGME